jgi:CBS domain-containing protein
MTVGEICNRGVIVTKVDTSIPEAVGLMKWYRVGDLVVVEEKQGRRVPTGILTDRDVALAVASDAARLPYLRVSDVMSRDLITSLEDESLREALKKMQSHGVRRLPIVNASGGLEGIVTLDDVIELLSEELTDLAKLVVREQKKERLQRLES